MQFVQVLCSFCAATNGLITPFIGQLQRKHSIFIKRYFKIVYIKRVRKVLCFRCFRCSCTLIGLYLLCTACASHRARSSFFFLNKGKGIGSPICRAAPRGCRRPCTPSTNTARAEGRGIKGGYAPFAGGPGTRRFLAYLCLLFSTRESRPGRGAERPPWGVQRGNPSHRWVLGLPSRKKLPRVQGGAPAWWVLGLPAPHKSPPGQRLAIAQPLQAIPRAAASSP